MISTISTFAPFSQGYPPFFLRVFLESASQLRTPAQKGAELIGPCAYASFPRAEVAIAPAARLRYSAAQVGLAFAIGCGGQEFWRRRRCHAPKPYSFAQ